MCTSKVGIIIWDERQRKRGRERERRRERKRDGGEGGGPFDVVARSSCLNLVARKKENENLVGRRKGKSRVLLVENVSDCECGTNSRRLNHSNWFLELFLIFVLAPLLHLLKLL